ncbi:MAG: sensor domain-containing diguanylate cyclase [Elusimicrobia bacterium]|nr:sensor domain-containing diguanylate cyclase [Elusimicrobiota bacterium]
MINSKFVRLAVPFLLFAGVSWLLWRYSRYFLWIFPAYGLVFLWLSPPPSLGGDKSHANINHQEKELKFLFVFLASAIGFMLPSLASPNKSVGSAVLSFAEVAALWALFYALNSSQSRAQEQARKVSAELSDYALKIKNLQGEIKMYSEHRACLLGRIQFQADLASSIQVLAACVNADEIKVKLEEMLKKSFPDAVTGVESGAARDSLAGWVAERKISLLIKNTAGENRFYPGDLAPGQGAIVVVPLNLFGSIAGFIRVASAKADSFSAADLRRLELISTIAAVSMENIYLYEKVKELAIKDGLTGIYTHRAFQTRMEEEILRAARTKIPFSLIMTDIDHFKSYNDIYGHQAGDAVLKTAALVLAENIRDIDFAARYGGEEFAVILTGVNKAAACAVAEHLRQTLESRHFSFGGKTSRVTASFGVAEFPSEAAISSQLVRAADERLYKAKKDGRNRVIYE